MPSQTKILIGFITAHHSSRWTHIDQQRAKMKNSPVDYKFIYGNPSSQAVQVIRPREDDELWFDVDDTRPYMVLKDKSLFVWALEHDYDYVFRCCDDTVVYPERMLRDFALLSQHDYAGTFCGYGAIAEQGIFALRYLDYMHGGVGCWLSRKAMEMLIADDWKGPYSSPYSKQIELTPGNFFKGSWHIYWDDLWMGEVLKGNMNYNDPRRDNVYGNYLVSVLDDPTRFASNTPFDPDLVIATHSLEQMGATDLHPRPFSTRTETIKFLSVNWATAKSDFREVKP